MEFTERKSGLVIPVQPPDCVKPGSSETVADWPRFRGCNSESPDNGGAKFGGGIQFGQHVGKPLSQSLWTDLVHRFQARSIWVLGPKDDEFTVGRFGPAATVYVSSHDDGGVVTDIRLEF